MRVKKSWSYMNILVGVIYLQGQPALIEGFDFDPYSQTFINKLSVYVLMLLLCFFLELRPVANFNFKLKITSKEKLYESLKVPYPFPIP